MKASAINRFFLEVDSIRPQCKRTGTAPFLVPSDPLHWVLANLSSSLRGAGSGWPPSSDKLPNERTALNIKWRAGKRPLWASRSDVEGPHVPRGAVMRTRRGPLLSRSRLQPRPIAWGSHVSHLAPRGPDTCELAFGSGHARIGLSFL